MSKKYLHIALETRARRRGAMRPFILYKENARVPFLRMLLLFSRPAEDLNTTAKYILDQNDGKGREGKARGEGE